MLNSELLQEQIKENILQYLHGFAFKVEDYQLQIDHLHADKKVKWTLKDVGSFETSVDDVFNDFSNITTRLAGLTNERRMKILRFNQDDLLNISFCHGAKITVSKRFFSHFDTEQNVVYCYKHGANSITAKRPLEYDDFSVSAYNFSLHEEPIGLKDELPSSFLMTLFPLSILKEFDVVPLSLTIEKDATLLLAIPEDFDLDNLSSVLEKACIQKYGLKFTRAKRQEIREMIERGIGND